MKSVTGQKGIVSPNKCWKMLGWLLLIQVFIAIIGRAIAPLGPLIAEELLLTKLQIGLLPASLFMGQFLIALPAGYLSDKYGVKKILLLLSLCVGLSFALVSIINTFEIIVFLILLGGIGYGAMHTTSTVGILDWFTQKKRGTAMGIKQMGVSIGSIIAVMVLLPLALQWGWRIALFLFCICLIVIGFVVYYFYEDSNSENNMSHQSFIHSIKHIIKNKSLFLFSLVAMLLVGTQTTINTYIVFFALEELKYTIVLAGSLLIISEISGGLGRLLWGTISDKFFSGNRIIVMSIIAFISFLCSISVIFLNSNVSVWLVILIVSLFGFTTSGFNGIWMNTATESVDKNYSGIASGYSLSIGSIGAILITPLFGLIVDASNGYGYAMAFISCLMVVVMILLLTIFILGRNEKDDVRKRKSV